MNSFPLIGVTGSIEGDEKMIYIKRCYMNAIIAAGGVPVMLSPDPDDAMMDAMMEKLDGLFLTGGNDMAPEMFGDAPIPQLGEVNPVRDLSEIALTKKAVQMKMPILGICRGIQSLNVAMGGTLWQDLPSQYRTQDGQPPMAHRQNRCDFYTSHSVLAELDTLLYKLVGRKEFWVNSFHHQAVRTAAPDMKITARASDGVIEAIELPNHPFCLGVQWHPERYYDRDETAMVLFSGFVEAAKAFQAKKQNG